MQIAKKLERKKNDLVLASKNFALLEALTILSDLFRRGVKYIENRFNPMTSGKARVGFLASCEIKSLLIDN